MIKRLNKIQKGGLLIEALAILGIVAVTSPMIYKKKVDKSQELEDIAKASQMKIVREAVNNYIDANYDAISNGSKIKLNDAKLKKYLPPGFSEDDNIDVGFRVENVGGNLKVNALIVDNEKYNEKRGNRIAGLIGADGGYATDNNRAFGGNMVWSVRPSDYGINGAESQIVATTSFSKSAATGEFLYKYKLEGQPEVNRMMTNIDMGGNDVANGMGNDINNAGYVGLKYGRDDNFDSIRINDSHNNPGKIDPNNSADKGKIAKGDGTIEGRNKSQDVSFMLQSNREGKTLNMANAEPNFSNGVEGATVGHGALTLLSDKLAPGSGRGCVEALSNSDLSNSDGMVDFDTNNTIGTNSGVVSLCNNNTSRTAYLISKGSNNSGEMRVRQDGKSKTGATVYADKSTLSRDYGATFEATDNNDRPSASLISEKSDVNHDAYFSSNEVVDDVATLELARLGDIKSRAIATTNGGAMYLKDTGTNQETVKLIGKDATVLTTKRNEGHAGITGDYQRTRQGKEEFAKKAGGVGPNGYDPKDRGALFVRNSNDTYNTALISGDKNDNSGDLVLSNNEAQKVRATSNKGGALYMSGKDDYVKVGIEGSRQTGSIEKPNSLSGYAEVRGSNTTTSSEMYPTLTGKLSSNLSSGVIEDNSSQGGGAYMGYHLDKNTVKLMSNSGYDGSGNDLKGGSLELTEYSGSSSKAILTNSLVSPSNSNIGSAMKLVGGNGYVQVGENSYDNAGEALVKGSAGGVSMYANDTVNKSSVKVSDASGNAKVEINSSQGGTGVINVNGPSSSIGVKVYGQSGAGGRVTATNKSGKVTAILSADDSGTLELKNDSEEMGAKVYGSGEFNLYRPKNDGATEYKKSVFANADGLFQSGQNKKMEAKLNGTPELVDGVDSIKSASPDDVDIKGVILIRNNVNASSAKASAPIIKAKNDISFKDICILGKDGDGACLMDAAKKEAGGNLPYTNLKDSHTPSNYSTSVKNFGQAMWQLIATRVVDLFDSSDHNDTHHLKSAWGDKVDVGGKMSLGSALYKGKYHTYDYVTNDAKFVRLSDDDDGGTGVKQQGSLRYSKPFKISYRNVETGKIEEYEKDSEYHKYNDYSVESPNQYAAAGHEHGATGSMLGMGYKPMFDVGNAEPYSGGRMRGSTKEKMTESPKKYAAKGHWHANYSECGEVVQYRVKKITPGILGEDAITTNYVKSISLPDRKCGKDFYQGNGYKVIETSKKWNYYTNDGRNVDNSGGNILPD